MVCLLISLSGCSWAHPSYDSIRYYILALPGSTNQILSPKEPGAVVVLLNQVVVPSYLQSKRIAVRSGGNEIQYSDFDQWGERLDQGIARVMGETLNRATNILSVAHQQHGGIVPDWEIRTRILACEGVRVGLSEGFIRFEMVWEISAAGGILQKVHRGGFNAPRTAWNPNDTGELARLLSAAVVDAAVHLASDISPTPPGSQPLPQPASGPRLPL